MGLVLVSILALLLLSGTPSACSTTSACVPWQLVALSGLAITISAAVIAIGYFIGKLIPASGILTWIRNEYWELGKTAIILAATYAILIFMGNLATALAGSPAGGNTDIVCTVIGTPFGTLCNDAWAYLYSVQSTLNTGADAILNTAGAIGTIQTVQLNYFIPYPPVETPFPIEFTFGWQMNIYKNDMLFSNPLGSIGQYESIVNDMINLVLTPVILINLMQLELLPAFSILGLFVLIPLGLLLRAFPVIRGIGGTLIAVGIGVALIYPAVLIFLNQFVVNAIFTSSPICTGVACGGSQCPSSFGVFCSLMTAFVTGPAYATGVAWGSIGSIFPALNFIISFNGYVILYFILFIADIIIVYPFMDYAAKTLGNPAGLKLSIGGKFKL